MKPTGRPGRPSPDRLILVDDKARYTSMLTDWARLGGKPESPPDERQLDMDFEQGVSGDDH